nr:hypothetical protein [Tanacetum cinerariifolium]
MMKKSSSSKNEQCCSKACKKNIDSLNRYSAVPPPPAQLYLSPKKDLSWTGHPECADDTVTDYSRPSPTIESTSASSSTISPKPFIKFVKAVDKAAERSTTNKVETVKKPAVRYAKLYRKPSKKSTVRGNQRNWNNLKPPMRPMGPNMNSARPNKPAHSYGRRPFQETTQDLMIILIQRVQRLERELKARTPIQKVDRGRSRCSIKFRRGLLGIKCSKIFPLSVMNSHCQKKFPLLEEVPTARIILPLVCTAGEDYSQSKMH